MGLLRSVISGGGPPRKANGQVDYAPKRHHGFLVLIFICGFIFPPLACAVRFGIGKDFFICLILTICGWLPGHGYNFFVQNIRDNSNAKRTPRWALRYGLVDDSDQKKLAKSRYWSGRYADQMPSRTMYDEDGNEVVYQHGHRYEDGDSSPVQSRRPDSTLVEPDRYHREGGMSRDNSDPYSLRRTSTSGSHASSPGSAARSSARNKSKARAFLGKGKSGSNRHAKTDEVMGSSDFNDPSAARRRGVGYHSNGFDGGDSNSFNDSLEEDLRRGGHRGMGNGSSNARYDMDGPEDADARYRPSNSNNKNNKSSSSSSAAGYGNYANGRDSTSSRTSARVNNDGLDHTF